MKATILISLMSVLFYTQPAFSQDTDKKIQKAKLSVDAQCHECEEKIEEDLRFAKGIVYANVILDQQILSVKYNKNKTDIETIKKRVSALGYTIDGIEADPKAKNNMGHVCEEHKHHGKHAHD